MRRAVTLLAAVSLVGTLVGCSVIAPGKSDRDGTWTAKARPFTSPDGYSFNPPKGWQEGSARAASQASVVFFAPSIDPAAKFVDNILVGIHPPQQDLETTVANTKLGYRTLVPSYRSVVDEPATANGQAAWLLGGTFDYNSVHVENLQLLLMAAGKQYTVTFSCPAASYAGLADVARTSLLSFHLV
ncbi:hypothetical protein [Kribbella sp. NPDC048928]|uniref:hypothetical protein n=1 Tax=Kribbella sp. NPDC048928 TaxID=3364111 RepID=UPI00371C3032